MNEKQNRFKSKVTILAIAGVIITLLTQLGIFDELASESIRNAIVAIVNVLVVFGVLNNPTDKNSF